MPVGSVNNDHYGVDRPGADLFSDSLVAVDVKTGKLKWYFQAIHHDLWDYDMPAAPMLFDVVHDGKKIPAVAAMTKNPLLFILNRVTGEALYGVEERPVPAGDVPGEWYSPTQPFPLKPPPLSRQSFTENDFAKITPEHDAACRVVVCKLFCARRDAQQRAVHALLRPMELSNSPITGAELGCGAEHSIPRWGITLSIRRIPARCILFRPSPIRCRRHSTPKATANRRCSIAPAAEERRRRRRLPSQGFSFSANGWPCWAPPWGRLTAVDVNTGDIAWQVPYGTMNGVPAGMATGAPSSRGGPTTTAGGLIFMTGTFDHYFRALETKTGKELWSFKMDQAPLAVPIVYMGGSGKEYVAIVSGWKPGKLRTGQPSGARPRAPILLSAQAQLPEGDR